MGRSYAEGGNHWTSLEQVIGHGAQYTFLHMVIIDEINAIKQIFLFVLGLFMQDLFLFAEKMRGEGLVDDDVKLTLRSLAITDELNDKVK